MRTAKSLGFLLIERHQHLCSACAHLLQDDRRLKILIRNLEQLRDDLQCVRPLDHRLAFFVYADLDIAQMQDRGQHAPHLHLLLLAESHYIESDLRGQKYQKGSLEE